MNSESRPEGSGCNPCVGGTCKNLLRAAGDPRGVQMTSERSSNSCIYNASVILFFFPLCSRRDDSGVRTSCRTDLAFGRMVRGPASRRTLPRFPSLSYTLTRSLRTHPPKRALFSSSVICTVGCLRARWKAAESPVIPPPRITTWLGSRCWCDMLKGCLCQREWDTVTARMEDVFLTEVMMGICNYWSHRYPSVGRTEVMHGR